jgi:uncharacterized glyoxalase superfamily protein PhnB
MAHPIPEGLTALTPQLNIDGANEAIQFYVKAFGAEELMRAPDPSGKKIWHAVLRIGGAQFFVNDHFPEMGGTISHSAFYIYLDGVDAAFQRAVDAGAKVRMPLADMFWGDRLGTVIDPWGNQWTLAQHVKDLTPAELQQAQDAAVAAMNATRK